MQSLLYGAALALLVTAGGARADDNPTRPGDKEKEKEKAKATTLGKALYAVGGVTAAYIHEAHQKIGLLGDAQAKGVYTAEVASRELGVTINLLKGITKVFIELEKTDIKDEDKKGLKALRDIIALEIKSAEGLQAFWKSKDKDDIKTYSQNRESAWDKLTTLFGIKKPKDKDKIKVKPKE